MSRLTKDVPPYAGQQSFIVRAIAAAAGTRTMVVTEDVKGSSGLAAKGQPKGGAFDNWNAAPSRGAKRSKDWGDTDGWNSKKHKGVCHCRSRARVFYF